MNGNGAVVVNEERVQHKTKKEDGKGVVEIAQPYFVEVTVEGTEMILLHRYDVESVKQKAGAKKGSADKKTDNVESYVYRDEKNEIGLPGLNFKAAVCEAAKFSQDPRSPRKSARDLFRAGLRCRGVASFGKDKWDLLDTRKVNVQRNAVPRVRPAMLAGWRLTFTLEVLLPEYITPTWLNELVTSAGRLCGLGDFRPDFGTFMVNRFEVLKLS
jgi:hypothetical protein